VLVFRIKCLSKLFVIMHAEVRVALAVHFTVSELLCGEDVFLLICSELGFATVKEFYVCFDGTV
jgi:hypothetical protein